MDAIDSAEGGRYLLAVRLESCTTPVLLNRRVLEEIETGERVASRTGSLNQALRRRGVP
jgi:hypothetical protein